MRPQPRHRTIGVNPLKTHTMKNHTMKRHMPIMMPMLAITKSRTTIGVTQRKRPHPLQKGAILPYARFMTLLGSRKAIFTLTQVTLSRLSMILTLRGGGAVKTSMATLASSR